MSETTDFPAPPEMQLGVLCGQLAMARELLARACKELDSKTAATTFQSYRWLGGAMQECEKQVRAVAKAADIVVVPVKVEFIFQQIETILVDAEARLCKAFEPSKLDELPPGNPKEVEFERLLKIKIATNKAYAEAMQNLAALTSALTSDTHKVGLPEDLRVKAWREERRGKLTEVLGNTAAELKKARAYVDSLVKVHDDLAKKLEDNDQLVFDNFDPEKPVPLGL